MKPASSQTRRYAKRQLTWLRNQTPEWPRVRALELDEQWGELIQIPQYLLPSWEKVAAERPDEGPRGV